MGKTEVKLKALGAGDRSAFADIYSATDKAVYYLALSIVKDKTLAEDVMQTTFLSVLEHAASFRGGCASAWILSITRNTALNLIKKRAKEKAVDETENEALFGVSSPDDYGLLIDLARTTLNEDEFQILMLISAQGYKRREAAQIMSMPVATVTWKYNEALKKLKAELNGLDRSFIKGGRKK